MYHYELKSILSLDSLSVYLVSLLCPRISSRITPLHLVVKSPYGALAWDSASGFDFDGCFNNYWLGIL